ncbi:MAG TPA: hypothetical protein VGE27_03720 [Gemmatimonas sp.]|uniref:WD40/YVTN/BNR-like repeat-containing protein n=1 Tax=Gemmatimonas sp. TaxID=1962908 RepID=UPI002EDBA127
MIPSLFTPLATSRAGRTLCRAALLFVPLASARANAQGTAPRITEQQSGVTQLIQAVHATSANVVWASGPGGVVLRTLDGGTTWQRRMTPAGDSLQFRDVHAINADTAWVLSIGNGTASRIYRTSDGGSTWALQFINRDSAAFYDCLSFGNSREGLVFGDATAGRTHILRTTNGGGTWTLLPESVVPAPLPSEGAFAASGLCVAHANARTAYVATGAPGARLFKSTNAGATWSVLETPFVRGTVAGLTGVSFIGDRGVAVAADINRLRTDTSTKVVGITTDGGRTWTLGNRPPLPGSLSGVSWVPGAGNNTIVAVSYGGAFYSTSAGREWTTFANVVTTGVSAIDRTVWVGGEKGRIWRLDFPAATR